MSSNLLKGGYVVVTPDEKVTIDNNETIARRLEELSLKRMQEQEDEEVSDEEFIEGIDPLQVAQLTEDSSVIDEQRRKEIRQQEEELLRSAGEEADRLRAEAESEAKTIREDAYQEGYESGMQQGMADAAEKIAQQEAELQDRYSRMEAQLKAEYQQKEDQLEPEVVKVLTDIYEHVLGVDLKDKNDMILLILKKAMQQMDSAGHYIIHLSRDDVMTVKLEKASVASACGIREENLEILEDNTVAPGGCMIESEYGVFDCGLDTQLSLLKKQLEMISYQRNEN